MKYPELLLCPLCGGVAGKTTDPIGYGEAVCIIACTQCDCCVNVSGPDFNVVESEAIKRWNTRVYPPEVQAAIERDTPKKPIFPTIKEQSEDREDMPRCPDCINNMGKVIGRARQSQSFPGGIKTVEYNLYGWNVQPFCPECGQRLDWSEE